jgi:CRP-like cAMP-binding protein
MNTTIEKVIHLQRIKMFSDIPSNQLAHVAGIARDVRFKKGEQIFTEGKTAEALFILIDGAVSMSRKGKQVRKIGQDGAFGILRSFNQTPRAFTAVALEDSYLLKIKSLDFFDLIEDQIHLSRGLIDYLIDELCTVPDGK